MKQIFQSLKDGSISVEDLPVPVIRANHVLIENRVSLISAGTERMLLEFGKAGWIGKVRQQPDKVKMVLEKARTDGIFATLDAVKSKIDMPLTPGYCAVGVVRDTGRGVEGLAPGTRVVSNGCHAEVVMVPHTLTAAIPDSVDDETASFTVLGAIGLQGIRLAQPTIGESVVVMGLGLIGLMTVQMLLAQGCRVLGIDLNPVRCEMARSFGAEALAVAEDTDVVAAATDWSRGRGVDAVLLTVSTSSNGPVSQAAQMCRQRGRIVLVGVTGLELSRADFYEKELSFQVSCSYGPGRYDPNYEDKGQDYPLGFVRWTEQRNFEAVLDLMAAGKIDVRVLITHRFAIEEGEKALGLLTSEEPSIGILLLHNTQGPADITRRSVDLPGATPVSDDAAEGKGQQGSGLSFLGVGNYASRVLIPAFKDTGARFRAVVSGGGASAVHFGKKFGFARACTDAAELYADDGTHGIVIATRHNQHSVQVLAAMHAGKHVFCEKPLCLTLDELAQLEAADPGGKCHLMVGFNRRYAPLVQKMTRLLDGVAGPKSMVLTVNAGEIPMDHWTQDREIGGGRIVGEACHFIDLARYFAGHPVASWSVVPMGLPDNRGAADTATINLTFEDGSTAAIHYFANGQQGFPKERVEVFAGGRILQLDNFISLKGFGTPGFLRSRSLRQDKGQAACAQAFVMAMQGDTSGLIPRAELFEVMRLAIEAEDAVRA